jgi:hypothetical protein
VVGTGVNAVQVTVQRYTVCIGTELGRLESAVESLRYLEGADMKFPWMVRGTQLCE